MPNSGHFSFNAGFQGNQTVNANRNSNMRVVLRGGAGTSHTSLRGGGGNRVSQSMYMNREDAQATLLGASGKQSGIQEVDQINDLLQRS